MVGPCTAVVLSHKRTFPVVCELFCARALHAFSTSSVSLRASLCPEAFHLVKACRPQHVCTLSELFPQGAAAGMCLAVKRHVVCVCLKHASSYSFGFGIF